MRTITGYKQGSDKANEGNDVERPNELSLFYNHFDFSVPDLTASGHPNMTSTPCPVCLLLQRLGSKGQYIFSFEGSDVHSEFLQITSGTKARLVNKYELCVQEESKQMTPAYVLPICHQH